MMNPRALLISTAFLLLGMSVRPAMADPTVIVNSSNVVTQIDNLVINGTTYDMTFGSAFDATFDTEALANTASTAVDAALNDVTSAPYPWYVGIYSPFEVTYNNLGGGDYEFALNVDTNQGQDIAQDWKIDTDEGATNATQIAQFTEVPSTVPEPATVTTLLGGAIFLLVLQRRRKPVSSRRPLVGDFR